MRKRLPIYVIALSIPHSSGTAPGISSVGVHSQVKDLLAQGRAFLYIVSSAGT